MASYREKTTKNGKKFFEIRVRVSRDRPELTKRWYPPAGWSKKAIERQLLKECAEFERQAKAGEVLSHQEQKSHDEVEATKSVTLRKYAETVFMPSKSVTIAENTRDVFQRTLDLHILPALGERVMKSISSADISGLLLEFQASGQSYASCKKLYTVLNIIFKMAYQQDVIANNPMLKVPRLRPRKDEVQCNGPEAFTIEELRYILDCLSKEPLKWQALTMLEINTGCRRGESVGLEWRDIDFASGRVTFRQSVGYTAAKGVYVSTPKNSKTRTANVDSGVMALLSALWREQAGKQLSRFVFPMDNNPASPMHPQSPTKWMQKFGEKYGIPHMHPHKLRHSFATIAITEGADIASVSGILGHSSVAVTLSTYTHASAEGMERASAIFRQAIEQKKA